MLDYSEIEYFIKNQFQDLDFIPLHAPIFKGNERKYVIDAIDSTFVSSVGEYVNRFEEMMIEITGAKYSIATVNGTSALHMALILADVNRDDEVLTQSLTFIATCNAISYIGAHPIFIDVDMDTMGLSPYALDTFLNNNAEIKTDGFTYNKLSGKRIKACVPMHTFGLPCRIDEIFEICLKWNIILVEDAAESLGSYYKGKHTGVFGKMGTFSFNGNKTVTCGGGGAIVTNDEEIAKKAKHLTTQAKVPHKWEFVHDQIGFNYRMPNLNAALACAQLEQLDSILESKKDLAVKYDEFFKNKTIKFVNPIPGAQPNFWLNALILRDREQRDEFLTYMNNKGVMCRPAWELMHKLPMFKKFRTDNLTNSDLLSDRVVNIPSSARNLN